MITEKLAIHREPSTHCPVCGNEAREMSAAVVADDGSRLFECLYCGRMIHTKDVLRVHHGGS